MHTTTRLWKFCSHSYRLWPQFSQSIRGSLTISITEPCSNATIWASRLVSEICHNNHRSIELHFKAIEHFRLLITSRGFLAPLSPSAKPRNRISIMIGGSAAFVPQAHPQRAQCHKLVRNGFVYGTNNGEASHSDLRSDLCRSPLDVFFFFFIINWHAMRRLKPRLGLRSSIRSG